MTVVVMELCEGREGIKVLRCVLHSDYIAHLATSAVEQRALLD